MSSDIVIQIKNLSKKYTLKHPVKDVDGNITYEHWALNEVSFEIKKGEAVGIIGPNGSGKSTLLKILSGITKPTSGSVEIRGRVASILDIGAGFHQELSGRENIYLNGQILGFKRKEIKQQFENIVAFSGIENFINEPVKNYSNGMYLRLAFSILVHLDFDIYLFDEVMSVGDAEFNLKCDGTLKRMINEQKTLIFVSHNTNEIIKNCASFMLFKNGKLLSKDKHLNNVTEYVEKAVKPKDEITQVTSFETIPFPENFIIHSASLSNVNNTLFDKHTFLFREDEFKFILDFSNSNENCSYDLSISIQNIWGNIVLTSSPIGSSILYKEKDTGTFRIECIFPKDFFNEGYLFFNVNFIKNKKEVVLHLPKLLSISVKTKEKYKHIGNTLTEYPCLIAPKLSWSEYKKLNNALN